MAPGPVVTGLPTLLTSRPRVERAEKRVRQPFTCAEIKLPEEIERRDAELEERPMGLDLVYKNTFLEAAEPMSPSLRPFYQERSVQTCPGSQAGLLHGLFLDCAHQTPMPSPAAFVPPTPCYWGDAAAASRSGPVLFLADMVAAPAAQGPATPRTLLAKEFRMAMGSTAPAPMASAPLPAGAALPPCAPPMASPKLPPGAGLAHLGLGLPQAPPMAAAADDMPSLGSALHGSGQCKPCAFLYTKGCENGAQCQFCHLCDANERKRRRQAKLEQQKAARRASQVGNMQ